MQPVWSDPTMKIFLSHHRHDKPLVLEFKDLLTSFLLTWLDEATSPEGVYPGGAKADYSVGHRFSNYLRPTVAVGDRPSTTKRTSPLKRVVQTVPRSR
jgi:hypothetical protein